MRFLVFFSVLCLAPGLVLGQSDSLLVKLENAQETEKVAVLHEIVRDLWLNYPKLAMKYGEEALQLSRELNDSALVSQSLRFIAGVYFYKGDYEESLAKNVAALTIAEQLQDSSLINNGYNNIGLLYFELGNYQLALEYFLRCVQMKERIDETYGLSTTLNNIGLVFVQISQFEEARDYFLEAYQVAEKYDEQDIKLYAINNVGFTFLREGNLDAALSHFRRGASLSETIDNINWGSVSLRGLGEVLLEKGQLDSARLYFEEALQMSREIDDKKGLSEANYLLARHALTDRDSQRALGFLLQSNQIAQRLQLRQQQLKNLKLYADIFAYAGDNKQQSVYLEQYITLKDSLLQGALIRTLSLIPLKLKDERDLIALSRKTAELQSQTLKNDLFTLAIMLVVPLVIFLVILLRKNAKKAAALQSYNDDLKKAQNLLITQEKMASLGVLAAGVGHEINNPLNFIKNGVGALSHYLKIERGETDEQVDTYLKIVDEGVVRATKIVSSLSHFSRAGESKTEVCKINEIIENCLLILHNKIRDRIQIVTVFDEEAKLIGNEGRLHQAFLNIIANGAQAIEESGTIEIVTKREQRHVVVEISDDGSGISEKNLTKIRDPFFTTKPPGVGTGLGLYITSNIIEEHNGSMEIQSKLGVGTRFILTLPLP